MKPFESAVEMMAALRRGVTLARELLEFHLERVERYNKALNAIVIHDFEHAREAADEADRARKSGSDGPLLGLPITVKDCIDVRWMRGPAGEPEHAQRRPRHDSPVAARLREAGAVFLGKTNVPPLASDWECENPLFGRTENPWDPSRTPGGSTGGGAAAVAAGLSPLELGSDISGSIRVPAAFCGVYGHKPSETAVPRSGHFPGSHLQNPAAVFLSIGPLARSAEDLELAFDIIAGPEPVEDTGWRLDIPPPRHNRLSDYRVGVMPSVDWLPVDDEITSALDRLAGGLALAGAAVELVQPHALNDLRERHQTFCSLLGAMTAVSRSESERREQAEKKCEGEFEQAYCSGFTASAVDYLGWIDERERVRASFRDFFEEWDILLTPANIVNAFPYTNSDSPDRTIKVNGREVGYYLQLVYAGVASLGGQPVTVFPAGLTRAGLPIGLQAIGPYLEDRMPIRFAGLLSREFGGFRPPPNFV
ncbi:MAG TPA: amidase family protein [Armatimonadota bacterium]|nr:amidase family protein [Armatimonadota bacterium]